MITLYSSDNCPACEKAKQHLQTRNAKYVVKNISLSKQACNELSDLGFGSVPVLFDHEKKSLICVGYSKNEIDKYLKGGK